MNLFRVHRLPAFQAPDAPTDPVVIPPPDPAVVAAYLGSAAT